MFDPEGVDYYDEFIELVNISESPVNLDGAYLIINENRDNLVFPEGSSTVQPFRYALILDRGYLIDRQSFSYQSLIPDETLLLTIDNNSFGVNTLLNSEANHILLISNTGDTLSRIVTTPDQPSGFSDEKIQSSGPNSAGNWGNSTVMPGTPGARNSISPKDFDLAIRRFAIRTAAEAIRAGNPVEFGLSVSNQGLQQCRDADILFGIDSNRDSILQISEYLFGSTETIAPGDSIEFQLSIPQAKVGATPLIAEIDFESDERPDNNLAYLELRVAYPAHSLAITEIMYHPAEENNLEWIELLNISADTLNLKYWSMADQTVESRLTLQNINILPEEYCLIARDSSFLDLWSINCPFIDCLDNFPVLNNTGDSVIIRDLTGRVMDAIGYSSSWGYAQGISLERRNPYQNANDAFNWGLCESDTGATPGLANSIRLPDYDLELLRDSIAVLTPRVLPGDTMRLRIAFRNSGLHGAANYSFDINYYQALDSISQSPLIHQKIYPDTLPPFHTVIDTLAWKMDYGGYGYLYCSVHLMDDTNTRNDDITLPVAVGYPAKALVINEIMYDPESGKPEWFELYNSGGQTLNLQNWEFKDANPGRHTLSYLKTDLRPDSFIVVSAATDFAAQYPHAGGQLLQTETFPALNNSADSLVILDPSGHTVDSLFYESSWGQEKGVSLERRNAFAESNSAENWGLSQAAAGSTPGYRNAIATKDYDLAVDSIRITSPLPILHGDTLNLCFQARNAGLYPITDFDLQVRIDSLSSGSATHTLLDTSLRINRMLQPNGSSDIDFQYPSIPGGVFCVTADLHLAADGNPGDNRDSLTIAVGYADHVAVLNEILYAPPSGEAEWFEIYNRSTQPLNLNRWQFRDANGKWIGITDSLLILSPDDFVVLAQQTDFVQSYPDFDGTIVIPENFPTLNNRSDSLFMRDAAGHLIDICRYQQEWGGASGISIERRDPNSSGLVSQNWGSCEVPWGATPGDYNSILKFQYDLRIVPGSFAFIDTLGYMDEVMPFVVSIENRGMQKGPDFALHLYQDADYDTTADAAELAWSLYNIPCPGPDSLHTITGELYARQAGLSAYIAAIESPPDENPDDNLETARFRVSYPPRSLRCNEFLAYPLVDQTEFIEYFNDTDAPVDLFDWRLSDRSSRVHIEEHLIIPPETYLVLAADSIIDDIIMPTNCILHVPPKWPGFHNSADQIVLRDLTSQIMDSLHYRATWDILPGISHEKILPDYPSADSSSWQACIDPLGATPGRLNSVSPLMYDMSLDSLSVNTTQGDSSSQFLIRLYYHNAGLTICDSATISAFESGQAESLLAEELLPGLLPAQSDSLALQLGPFPSGSQILTLALNWPADGNPGNDSLQLRIKIAFPPESMRFSEFMPYPAEVEKIGTSIAEFVELRNSDKRAISLHGWYISDENTARRIEIYHPYSIAADSFLVIASDSSIFSFPALNHRNCCITADFPSLNNEDDQIILQDLTGLTIDSLAYDADWKIVQGVSQERIYLRNANTRSNWRSSVAPEGATPGQANSVIIREPLVKYGIEGKPNPFTPNGDGIDDEIGLHFQLPYASARVTIDIYDLAGRLIYNPAKNQTVSSTGVIYWNGDSQYGDKARVGMYVARLNASDTGSNKSVGYITTIVRAR